MKISIITLFPDMFEGPLGMSMLKKAQEKELVDIELIDLRQFGMGPRQQVDDTPYGGGDGMVLRPEPVVAAIEAAQKSVSGIPESGQTPDAGRQTAQVILLTPQGERFTQDVAWNLSQQQHLILVCGHYEGFDERIRSFADMQMSIGDYVLTGGELPAMVITDAVTRLIPGVLGGERSALDESFADGGMLEHPHYTRPEEFRGMRVPDVLRSGNHQQIADWRRQHMRGKSE